MESFLQQHLLVHAKLFELDGFRDVTSDTSNGGFRSDNRSIADLVAAQEFMSGRLVKQTLETHIKVLRDLFSFIGNHNG